MQNLYTLTDKAQGGDCVDTNGARHPLAVEICDGIDNDCDGSMDEGVFSTYYQDSDADGFGNDAVTNLSCSPSVGYVALSGDCLDTDARVNPTSLWAKDNDSD